MTALVYRVKTGLRLNLEAAVLVLVTLAALMAATTVLLQTEAVVLALATFLLLEGSGVGVLWRAEHQRARRELREAHREAERVQAAALAYGGQIARAILTLENQTADTQVLPVVHSTVYRARSHPLEDGRSIEMWSRLHEDTGDIATAR